MGVTVVLVLLMTCLFTIEACGDCAQSFSPSFGGTGGLNAFDDKDLSSNGDITAIELQCGRRVTAIKLRYGKVWSENHGWKGVRCEVDWDEGERVSYKLQPNEFITGASITYGSFVNSISFQTNKRKLPKCGNTTGSKQDNIRGRRLKYVRGNSGCIVDRIQFYWPMW